MSFSLPFLSVEHLAADVYTFYFDRSRSNFTFSPGQYIQMKLDIKNPDDRGDTRHFTIASSPTEKEKLQITSRIVESAFKEALLALKSGTKVQFEGPFGNFLFDEHDTRPKVFLAGGIGVTPFRSMCIYARDTKYQYPIKLFASFRVLADTTFFTTFKGLEETMPNFQFIPTITRPDPTDDWPGETGRITHSMIERHLENPADSVYYIVGPQEMVSGIIEEVLKLNVSRENIKFENFTGY